MLNVFSAVRRASNRLFRLFHKGASLRKRGVSSLDESRFSIHWETTHIETVPCHLNGHGSKVWLENV